MIITVNSMIRLYTVDIHQNTPMLFVLTDFYWDSQESLNRLVTRTTMTPNEEERGSFLRGIESTLLQIPGGVDHPLRRYSVSGVLEIHDPSIKRVCWGYLSSWVWVSWTTSSSYKQKRGFRRTLTVPVKSGIMVFLVSLPFVQRTGFYQTGRRIGKGSGGEEPLSLSKVLTYRRNERLRTKHLKDLCQRRNWIRDTITPSRHLRKRFDRL